MRPTLSAALVAVVLAGCATPEPTPAEDQPFASICDDSNEGQRVAVRGYLRLPESNTGDYSVMLRLFETPEFTGQPIGVSVRIGAEANQMDALPTSYTDSDLTLRTADGTVIEYGDAARVSGKVYVPMVGQDFACGLENPYIEAVN